MPTDTPTVTPSATSPPPPRDIKVRIEGRIDEIGGSHWVVSGQRINLRSSTSIKEDEAQAQVGGWAVVSADKKSDGQLVAREIVVVRGPDQPPQSVEFGGAIESIGADSWTISGRVVQIVSETIIEGTPEIGAEARVKAEQYADGRLVAKRITVTQTEEVVQFEGVIQSIRGDRWTVAGQEVLIGPDTQINGQPVVGAIAEVEAVVRADSSKLARWIRVESPPEPEPTPEPTDTPVVPTPEPTATPVTPEATDTSIPEPTETSAPEATATSVTEEPTATSPAPEPTATDAEPEPTATDPAPEPTATDAEPEPTATDPAPEPTANDAPEPEQTATSAPAATPVAPTPRA